MTTFCQEYSVTKTPYPHLALAPPVSMIFLYRRQFCRYDHNGPKNTITSKNNVYCEITSTTWCWPCWPWICIMNQKYFVLICQLVLLTFGKLTVFKNICQDFNIFLFFFVRKFGSKTYFFSRRIFKRLSRWRKFNQKITLF